MANLGSSIRSAARATSCAYKRLPIRWRLAGGSAALTLVILCGFAVIVGVLTTRQIEEDFKREVAQSADELAPQIGIVPTERGLELSPSSPDLTDFAGGRGAARVVYLSNDIVAESEGAPELGPPLASSREFEGWLVETRAIESAFGPFFVQYARRFSDVKATMRRVRVFLGLGVLGGAALALLAGLATARRAMSPVAELTEATREIARTRDPSMKLPHPEADDEVAELARTLEDMLMALDQAQTETEASLTRQREFVADASHELRTPLTAVLANLELLEEELEGEQRLVAASALRSSRRMSRLVADLLLLARADAGRSRPHEPLDLAEVVAEAAGELEPMAGDHQIVVSAPPGAWVAGARDELHRVALNLLENALRHTDPSTTVEATVERRDGEVVLAVEDDGPGIRPELREKVFERFYRGEGDRSGSTGLGLAIVRAVSESHGGRVTLDEPRDGRGARFVVMLPAAQTDDAQSSPPVWTGVRSS